MDVITKLLHASDDLKPSPNRNLYLEMGDTVRLYYRDVRLEMTHAEFEAFTNTFQIQAAELSRLKREGGPDGADDGETIKIWSQSDQGEEAACHPRRLTLEQCNDGYHLNLRNVRLILGEDEMAKLKTAISAVPDDGAEDIEATSIDEVVTMLDINEIEYQLTPIAGATRRGQASHRLTVDERFSPKLRRVLTGLGLAGKVVNTGAQIYANGDLAVELTVR